MFPSLPIVFDVGKGGFCRLDRSRPGTGEFRGYVVEILGPIDDAGQNVDDGLFSATHWKRDAGNATECGFVAVRCAFVIGERVEAANGFCALDWGFERERRSRMCGGGRWILAKKEGG